MHFFRENAKSTADFLMNFWSDKIWLPPGIRWADLEKFEQDGGTIPHFQDLYLIIPFSLAIIGLRSILEKVLFKPIGHGFTN